MCLWSWTRQSTETKSSLGEKKKEPLFDFLELQNKGSKQLSENDLQMKLLKLEHEEKENCMVGGLPNWFFVTLFKRIM